MLERSKEVVERWKRKGMNALGQLLPSNKPVAVAVKYKPEKSMFEIVREAVRSQKLADEMNAKDMDTFEEANDFDVEDDPFPTSRYERPFEEMRPGELSRRAREARVKEEADRAKRDRRVVRDEPQDDQEGRQRPKGSRDPGGRDDRPGRALEPQEERDED